MSFKNNEVWLASALENFEQAVLEDNLHLALSIIHDVRHFGFGHQAEIMENEINRIATGK